MDLTTYEAAKFELAEVLRAILAQAPKGHEVVERGGPELFARLAEDRFNLLVVGRFSRGKTSLMNAILGTDRLPTGLLPLTSVITSVSYGSPEEVRILFERGSFAYPIPFDQLADHVTEKGNPGNRRKVRMANVSLPVEILRRGFYFVDSPGLGSAILENTRTTESFLPEADAVMLVSGFEAPLTDEEQQVMRSVSATQRPLFFVLNKQDTVSAEGRAEVQAYVQHRLCQLMQGETPRIFSISARDALAAKLEGRHTDLEATGVPALERELVRFLIEDKGRAFLTGMCDRSMQLLQAASLPNEHAAGLLGRLTRLRGRFASTSLQRVPSDRIPQGAVSTPQPARMGDCALCAAIGHGLFDHLSQYQYQLATYAEAGERLAQERGLCSPHLRLYVSMTTDRSVCLALTPLVKQIATQLQEATPEALQATRPKCSLCELQERIEEAAIPAWLGETSESKKWDGVCLPHLRRLMQLEPVRQRTQELSRIQAQAAVRLAEDMQRYVLKRDGIRRDLTTEEEAEAAQRVITFLAGHRTVVFHCKRARRRSART